LKKLNTVDGKRKAKYVVGNPMLKRERKSENSKILNFALKKMTKTNFSHKVPDANSQ